MLKIAHLLDDNAMGGVMTALQNFDDPRIRKKASSEVFLVETKKISAQKFNVDVIIIHFTIAWAKLHYLISLRLSNPTTRIILIEHSYTRGFEKWKVSNQLRFRAMLNIAYRICDSVIGVSHGQTQWLREFYSPVNLISIPQSRPLKSFSDITINKSPYSKPITFGAIGRFHEQKGFSDLISAFKQAETRSSSLLLAGYGDDKESLLNQVGNDRSIKFIGKVKNPEEFYSQVDVVIIPSRWEAYGLVASEAMAAGKLVLAADVDGLPEQIEGAGIIYTSKFLSEKISEIALENRPKIIEMGLPARAAAMPRYDMMIKNWCQHLTG